MKILLTDILTRKAFDIFNIIKNHFDESNVILANTVGSKKKSKIIYKKKIWALRKDNQTVFSHDLIYINKQYKEEKIVYIPVEEDTTILFFNFIQNEGDLNFVYLLPDKEMFNLSRDKFLLNKYCIANNIPSPVIIEKINPDFFNNNFFPLLIKPRVGSGAKGFIHIDDRKDLYKLKNIKINNYVIQEKIENGREVKGAFFLCNKGEVIVRYCHERIRTFPISGGVSVFSKISDNNEIINIGSNLLRKLNWSGFAMIEFLWDAKTKTYKVIEINPRLWGSILLSEFAETHFLKNYVSFCLNKPTIKTKIKTDVKIRWMPFDFINWLKMRGKINNFWKIDKKHTCYINCTYATVWSSFWFHLFFYFNKNNLQVFFKKWKK